MEEHINTTVVIVGAGPAGLATSACLNLQGIANIVLEREDCCASLWKKRAYDRVKLHLAKEFCQLPHMSFPPHTKTFISRKKFIKYLDDYATKFKVNPLYCRLVNSAYYDFPAKRWIVEAINSGNRATEVYISQFLVVATGENSEGDIPGIPGLSNFSGQTIHSSRYENGETFAHTKVLVVGSGNSGMEIAYDLAHWHAFPSIVIRSPIHVLTKETVYVGMKLLKFFPVHAVDKIVIKLSEIWHGDLAKLGIQRPQKGPFLLKVLTGRSPVIDVGAVQKIKKGEIVVIPAAIEEIEGHSIKFSNGSRKKFDTIIFATGYRSTVANWLKDESRLFNEQGRPKEKKPNQWKGDDGLYCAGFGSSGLFGISRDAVLISENIISILKIMKKFK